MSQNLVGSEGGGSLHPDSLPSDGERTYLMSSVLHSVSSARPPLSVLNQGQATLDSMAVPCLRSKGGLSPADNHSEITKN